MKNSDRPLCTALSSCRLPCSRSRLIFKGTVAADEELYRNSQLISKLNVMRAGFSKHYITGKVQAFKMIVAMQFFH